MYLDNIDNKKIDDAIKASGLKKKFIVKFIYICLAICKFFPVPSWTI